MQLITVLNEVLLVESYLVLNFILSWSVVVQQTYTALKALLITEVD